MDMKFYLLLLHLLTVKSIAQEDTCDEAVATESGYACYFPFVYEDKVHSQCITAGKDRPWCALIPEVDDVSNATATINWDYCIVKTNGSGTCKFPFTYNNVTYNECASDGQEHDWCTTSQDGNEWGYCRYPCFRTESLVYSNPVYRDLCPSGQVAIVLAAEFDSPSEDTCKSSGGNCRLQVQKQVIFGDVTGDVIYESLRSNCNFRQRCEEVKITITSINFNCCNALTASDYIRMTYKCVQETELYLCNRTLCKRSMKPDITSIEAGFEICSNKTQDNKLAYCSDEVVTRVEDCNNLDSCRPFTVPSTMHPFKDVCFRSSSRLEMVQYKCPPNHIAANLTLFNSNQSLCRADRYPVIDTTDSKLLCENCSNCDSLTEDNKLAIEESIKGACNWNESCLFPTVDDILPVSQMENATCGNYSITVETEVYYYCKQAIYRLTGEVFNDVLCEFPNVINITNVVKGVSTCPECLPSVDDDVFVVADEFPQYYDEVLAACNGRTNCSELPAEPANAHDLTHGNSLVTNYVLIEYTCEYNEEGQHTSVVHSSASSSSTPATGLDTGRSSTKEASNSSLTQNIAIGVSVGISLILVVTVVCCCKNRKSQDVSQGNDNKSFSADPESHEMTPGNAPSAPDNAYEYVKEDNMMRASLLEGAYQEIPGNHYVPNNTRPLSPTQDVPRVISLGNQSQPQRPLSYNISGCEYQEISSIEKARKSKLQNDKPTQVANKMEPINEKPTEEGTGNLSSDKQDYPPVEYAQVSKPKKQKTTVSGTENTEADELQNKPTEETMKMELVPTDEAMNNISSDMQDGSPDEKANTSKPSNEKREITSEMEQIETGELVENESYEGFSDIKAPEPQPEANDTNEKPDMQAAMDSISSDMQDGSPDENANISKSNNEKKEIMSETEQVETSELIENVSNKGFSDIKAPGPKPEANDTIEKPDPESKEDTEKPVMAVDEPKDDPEDRDKAEN